MGIAALLKNLSTRQQERDQTAADAYSALVGRLADGHEKDRPKAVEQILAGVGKSVDDLQRDVETLTHRRALRALVDLEPDLKTERDEVGRELDALVENFRLAKNEYHETHGTLYGRLQEIGQELSSCDGAKSQLLNTAPEFVRIQQSVAGQNAKPLFEELQDAERDLRREEPVLKRLRSEHQNLKQKQKPVHGDNTDRRDAEAKSASALKSQATVVEIATERMEGLRKQYADAQAEQAAVSELHLIP